MLDGDGAYANYMEPGALGDQLAFDMSVFDTIRHKWVGLKNAEIKAMGKGNG